MCLIELSFAFSPFYSLSDSFPFNRLTVLGLYLELSVLLTGYIFLLSILAEVPGLAAVPSTSFEHKPPQMGGETPQVFILEYPSSLSW